MLLPLLLSLATSTCDAPGPVGALESNLSVSSVRVEDGVAHLRLRVEAWPMREEGMLMHGETTVFVPVPPHDGWVSAATVRTSHGVDTLSLLEAHIADERMDAYRSVLVNGVAPDEERAAQRRAAAEIAKADEGVAVRIIAPCSEARVTVELELTVLSTSQDGAWRFAMPRPQRADGRQLRAPLPVDARGMEVLVDGGAFADGQVRALHPGEGDGELGAEGLVTVDVRPRGGPLLRGRAGLARVVPRAAPPDEDPQGAGDDDANADDALTDEASDDASETLDEPPPPTTILHLEVDVPRPLARAPDGLHLVFVLDASVSSGAHGLAAGWRILERILDAAPADARWAVVAIGRAPRVVVPAWRGRDERGAVEVAIENGSDVTGAVRLAQNLASDVDGVGRVVVLSDMSAASAGDTLAEGMRSSPLVHGVQLPMDVVKDAALGWERVSLEDGGTDDALAFERSGGILVTADASLEDERTLAAHLIAPTRIDEPAVSVGGREVAHNALSVRLGDDDERGEEWPLLVHEGQGVRADLLIGAQHRGHAMVRGRLWAERVEIPLERTRARDRQALALAAVGALSGELDDTLVRGASLESGVVSRTSSLVHVPSWRPLAPEDGGLWMSGCGCCGSCGGFMSSGYGTRSTCRGGSRADLGEREALMVLLNDDLAACKAPRARLTVEVEDLEILEVAFAPGTPTCVVERFWRHRLDVKAAEGAFADGAFEARTTIVLEAAQEPVSP